MIVRPDIRWLFALLLFVVACDRTPRVRIDGTIRIPPRSSSALVVPLYGAKRAFSVDPVSGKFAGTYGALNVDPRTIPLFVHVPRERSFLLLPKRDFAVIEDSSGMHVELNVDSERAPDAQLLPLSCGSESCFADLPAGVPPTCISTVIILDGDKAMLVPPGRERLPAGGNRLVAFFPLSRQRTRSLVITVVCDDQTWISEIATFDGP